MRSPQGPCSWKPDGGLEVGNGFGGPGEGTVDGADRRALVGVPVAAERDRGPLAEGEDESEVGLRRRRIVEGRHLGAVETANGSAHAGVEQVEDSEGAVAASGHGHDADEAAAVAVGEVGEGAELGLGIGEVVAVGVDDRGSEGAVVSAGDDDEVDLEAGPAAGVAWVGDSQGVGGGA